MLIMCSNLVGDLEKHRYAELAKVRAKRRRKMIEEEDKPKSKEHDDSAKEANKPMETEGIKTELEVFQHSIELNIFLILGETVPLSQEAQDNITASARALAHWALESSSEDDLLDQSQHLPLGSRPDLIYDPDLNDSDEFSHDNAGLAREEADAVRRSEYINSILVPSVPVSRPNIPVTVSTDIDNSTPSATPNSSTVLSNSNSQTTLVNTGPDPLDFIIGITGSPSRQEDTPGNLISVASNNWAMVDVVAGPSRPRNNTEESGPTSVTVPTGPGGDASNSNNGAEIPDWVDPSFLAALPDEMRAEVLAEQMRYIILES